MADRIAVMNAGKIEQFGSPLDLYRKPVNRFVAGFIGSPKMNFVDGAEAVKFNAHSIRIRPEHITVSREGGQWKGNVTLVEHLGADTFAHVDVGTLGLLTVRTSSDYPIKIGDVVFLSPEPSWIYRFDKPGSSLAVHS